MSTFWANAEQLDKANIIFVLTDDQRTDALCYLLDLVPTLCELAALPIPDPAGDAPKVAPEE